MNCKPVHVHLFNQTEEYYVLLNKSHNNAEPMAVLVLTSTYYKQ